MPAWYGKRYPKLPELETLAASLSMPVFYARVSQPCAKWDADGPICILVPTYDGPLARAWAVAHELGHLLLGHGPLGPHLDMPHEAAADAWAAGALIPEARIRHYGNASVGSLMGALHKNYQPIPKSGGIRKLAARIAFTRLRALEEAG